MPGFPQNNSYWGFPATGNNVSTLLNYQREHHHEKKYRKKLADGIPSDAATCKSQADRDGSKPMRDPTIAEDAECRLKEFTVPITTALLPHCTLCFYKDGALAPGSSIPESLDTCVCATRILSSSCAYCELSELEQRYYGAVNDRTRTDADGHEYLACECGSLVMLIGDAGELVRKCMGCGGLMTAPFTNYAGDEVVFEKKWMLPAMILPVAEAAHPEPSFLHDIETPSSSTVRPRDLEKSILTVQAPLPATESGRVDDITYEPALATISRRGRATPEPKCAQQASRQTSSTGRRTPLAPITNEAINSRRVRLTQLGQKVGKVPLTRLPEVMKGFAFSDVDTAKVVAVVGRHGHQEVNGKILVAVIEKVLGRQID